MPGPFVRAWISLVLAAMACQGSGIPYLDVEPDWSGEIMDVAIADGMHVCEGDLVALDVHAAFVADAIGSPDRRVLYYWTNFEEVRHYCPIGAGCAHPEGAIGTSYSTGLHEAAHVLAGHLGRSRPLWEEGLAEAFMPSPAYKGNHHPAAMLGQEALGGLSYPQAGHFFRWLWLDEPERALDLYAETGMLDDDARALAIFERVMGESLVDVGDVYLAGAPRELPSLRNGEESVLAWTDGEWRHTLEMDCDRPDTQAYGEWVMRTAFIDIETPGQYEVMSFDARFEIRSLNRTAGAALHWRTIGVGRLDLDAGRYQIVLQAEASESIEAVVVVRPTLLTQPTLPD
ncbi:MAG: hypothetical protein IAG13_03235 [Deltaproteobacteria bacterium]|nr:hypothetical protein [Nannocystaceae bacterium]